MGRGGGGEGMLDGGPGKWKVGGGQRKKVEKEKEGKKKEGWPEKGKQRSKGEKTKEGWDYWTRRNAKYEKWKRKIEIKNVMKKDWDKECYEERLRYRTLRKEEH